MLSLNAQFSNLSKLNLDYSAQIKTLQDQVGGLLNNVTNLNYQITAFQDDQASNNATIAILNSQMKIIQTELSNKTTTISQLDSLAKSLQYYLDANKSKLLQCSSELESLRCDLANNISMVNFLTLQMHNLQSEVGNQEFTIQSLTSQLNQANAKIAKLTCFAINITVVKNYSNMYVVSGNFTGRPPNFNDLWILVSYTGKEYYIQCRVGLCDDGTWCSISDFPMNGYPEGKIMITCCPPQISSWKYEDKLRTHDYSPITFTNECILAQITVKLS
jgi:peptidoglycan hydrolase CwlO-like protein